MEETFQNMHIGTINLDTKTSSTKLIIEAVMKLYDRIINKQLLVRRLNIVANNVEDVQVEKNNTCNEQINLFTNYQEKKIQKQQEKLELELELQKAMIGIKKKYGKNAILKGMNLQEGGTTIERNGQIGGHKE